MDKRYKICIFDLDGTLVDTMDRYCEIAAESIRAYHPDISPDEAKEMYMTTTGLPFSSEIWKLFPGDPRNEKIVDEFRKHHIDYVNEAVFFPESIPFIKYLRAGGYMTAISSSTVHSIVEEYIGAVAAGLFDCVLGASENMVKGKQHFGRIAEELDVDSDEMFFIGDTIIDGRLAAESSIDFAARITTYKREDFDDIKNVALFDSLDELQHFFPPAK